MSVKNMGEQRTNIKREKNATGIYKMLQRINGERQWVNTAFCIGYVI
jgi:hypothetical protein